MPNIYKQALMGPTIVGAEEILHVGVQHEAPTAWFLAGDKTIRIRMVPTGGSPDPSWTYVGTTIHDDLGLVWHWYAEVVS